MKGREVQGQEQGATRSRRPRPNRTVDLMHSPSGGPIRLEIELHSHDDRVEGRVGDGHGEPLQFSSWLELIAAIRTLTGRPPHESRKFEADDRGSVSTGSTRRRVSSRVARRSLLGVFVYMVSLLVVPVSAQAHAVPHLERYRVLTYNVGGIRSPGEDYAETVDLSERAKQIASYINKGNYDIVALNEVFSNVGFADSMRDDFLGLLPSKYPYHVDILGSDAVMDSGLMLFSKFPFVAVPTPSFSEECVKVQGDKCLVAFHQYQATAAEDGFAAKGIGFVQVANPRTESVTNVFFTHMQAGPPTFLGCVPFPPGCEEEVRARQVQEAIDFVDQWAPETDRNGDTLLMGDLNIRHANDDGTVTSEYQSLIADQGGFASIGLTDSWLETSAKDPLSTWTSSVNEKLDYILHRPAADVAFCVMHQTLERQFVFTKQTGQGQVSINASDHYPYAAVIGRTSDHCSPGGDSTPPSAGAYELPDADITFYGYMKHPGSYFWFHVANPGTYGFGIINSPVTMQLTAYPEDDLSQPLKAFWGKGTIPAGTRKAESVTLSPAEPFYLLLRVTDKTDPYWRGTFKLKVNWHDGSGPKDAIQLDPFSPYPAVQMSTQVVQPHSEVWFSFKTDALDSGQQQHLKFQTTNHPNLILRMRIYNKAKFDAGQQDLLLTSNYALSSGLIETPKPNVPNSTSPIPAKGSSYYLIVQKSSNSPPGTFEVQWKTNLFYVQFIELKVEDMDDDWEPTEFDEPEPIISIDGSQIVLPLGKMDEGDSHFFKPGLGVIKAGVDVDIHMYENQISGNSAGACLQAPTDCDDMGHRNLSPTNLVVDPTHTYLNVDLLPVKREFNPHFTNATDADGDYRVWYWAYKLIDQ